VLLPLETDTKNEFVGEGTLVFQLSITTAHAAIVAKLSLHFIQRESFINLLLGLSKNDTNLYRRSNLCKIVMLYTELKVN